jgi:hypothetical protein
MKNEGPKMHSSEERRYRRQMILAVLAALALGARGLWAMRLGTEQGMESGAALILVAAIIVLAMWMRWKLRPR